MFSHPESAISGERNMEESPLSKPVKKGKNGKRSKKGKKIQTMEGTATISPMLDPRTKEDLELKEDYIRNPDQDKELALSTLQTWSEEEVDLFKELFANHPKRFARIGENMKEKTGKECITFYYLTKHHPEFSSFYEKVKMDEFAKKEKEKEEMQKMKKEARKKRNRMSPASATHFGARRVSSRRKPAVAVS